LKQARAWIGTSGWNYGHWRGVLYPKRLPASEWLDHYARSFETVEVNNSFYKIPNSGSVAEWSSLAPRRFRFAIKTCRGATHFKKLKDPSAYVEIFLAPLVELGDRQKAPLLVQLPPNMGKNTARLESFLDVLKSAAGRHWKIAVEFRNPEWLCTEIHQLLDRKRAAICCPSLLEVSQLNFPDPLQLSKTPIRPGYLKFVLITEPAAPNRQHRIYPPR